MKAKGPKHATLRDLRTAAHCITCFMKMDIIAALQELGPKCRVSLAPYEADHQIVQSFMDHPKAYYAVISSDSDMLLHDAVTRVYLTTHSVARCKLRQPPQTLVLPSPTPRDMTMRWS